MKKILYVIAALLLMCGSCNETNEKDRYVKIGESYDGEIYTDLETGDSIIIGGYVDEESNAKLSDLIKDSLNIIANGNTN